MLDANSLQVTYRHDRGEPRGAHKKGTDWSGRGDCVDCNQCVTACPMGIDIKSLEVVNSPECIECGRCVAACPKPGEFLRMEWFGKVLKPVSILLISLLLFFGGLLAANQLGIFTVTSPTISSVTQSGKFLGAAD